MATYPPRRLLGARPLPSDPRRDPRRSGFTQGGGGSPRNLRCLCTHFQGLAARHHHLLRRALQFYGRLGMGEDKPQSWRNQDELIIGLSTTNRKLFEGKGHHWLRDHPRENLS
ncbi:uncharacterized protein LOC118555510 isoform X2 [Halichoerus grypus]